MSQIVTGLKIPLMEKDSDSSPESLVREFRYVVWRACLWPAR